MNAAICLRRLLTSLAATLLVACTASTTPTPVAPVGPAPGEVEAAIVEAFAALARPEIDDSFELLFLDLAHRRFGRTEGSGAMADYVMTTTEPPQPDRWLMARMGNAALPLDAPAIASIERSNSNRGLVEAMFCKEQAIPADYVTYAHDANAKGGYDLTHVLSGYAFAKEAGCPYPLPPHEVEEMVQATAAMLPGTGMTDLQIEAALILAWLGRKELLPADTLARLLSVRWKNGAWGQTTTSKVADGHATMLALNLMLELTATPRGPVVAR
jgi:hypothetical protein